MTSTEITWPPEVDLTNCATVGEQIRLAFGEVGAGDQVVIDLAEVVFADSTALGVLISARSRSLETGAELVLVNVPHSVARTMAISGLTELFTVR